MGEEQANMIKRKNESSEQNMLFQLLEDVRKKMEKSREDMEIFKRLESVINKVDFSVLDSEVLTSNAPKRPRSNNRKEAATEKLMVEIKRQIESVRTALKVIYEIENASFKKFISKNTIKDDSALLFFKKLNQYAEALPLWVDMDGESPPPLCGRLKAEKNYIAKDGDLVAAFVIDYADNKDSWILAEVISYDDIKKQYTIDDIYDEGNNTEHVVSWDSIIPLPKYRVDPKYNPNALFQVADNVLALYPNATCFYQAQVYEQPVDAKGCYKLIFVGDSSVIEVHQSFVINEAYLNQEVKE